MAKLTIHKVGTYAVLSGTLSNVVMNPVKAWVYIFNENGDVWQTTTNSFVTWNKLNASNYAITLTAIDTISSYSFNSRTYSAPSGYGGFRQFTWPSAITTGSYWVLTYSGTSHTASPSVICFSIFPYATDHSVIQVYWNGTDFADPLPNNYTTNVSLCIGVSNDQYTVTWFKNGTRITSGISTPTIQVIKRVDGTDLITSGIMTQIGSTGTYTYNETSNRLTSTQESYLIIMSATIDGLTRSYSKIVGIYGGNVIW